MGVARPSVGRGSLQLSQNCYNDDDDADDVDDNDDDDDDDAVMLVLELLWVL